MPAEDREDMVDVVVYYFNDDQNLYFNEGWQAKCSSFGVDELTGIRIVFVLLACQVVINV